MPTQITDPNNLIVSGNTINHDYETGKNGWFVGHFIDSREGLRSTDKVEVKWGAHLANEGKDIPDASETGTTLTLLISGDFVVDFPQFDRSIELKRAGDYVIFAPGVMHAWKALVDSVVVTVRWPSLMGRGDRRRP